MVMSLLKVKNKKLINKITLSLLKYNKNRNIISSFAIILTALMFTTIFTVGFGLKKSMEYERMRLSGGDYHISFKNLDSKEVSDLRNNKIIKSSSNRNVIGYAKNNEFYGENVEVSIVDNSYYKHSFIKLNKGTFPKNEKDIIIDESLLNTLGLKEDINQKINLLIEIQDSKTGEITGYKSDEFNVSGIFKSDELSLAKFIFLNKDYAHTINIPKNNNDLYLNLNNSLFLDKKANNIIKESGYVNSETNKNSGISYGVNWAYSSVDFSSLEMSNILIIVFLLLVIILTGYLIIYNIFNISAFLDIKIYGLMKSIGTTSKQLKRIILRQALLISLWSIPIGLILGYLLGNFLLPKIIYSSTMDVFIVSKNPLIFILTSLFTLFTVYISASKPGRKVGKISALEAINSNDLNLNIKKSKVKFNIKNLGKINVKRNKSKLYLVVLSISLSVVVLNSTIIFLGEPDLNKYLEDFISSDFVLADKSYFNYQYSKEVPKSTIETIKKDKYFKDGGSIYFNYLDNFNTLDNKKVTIYGMDNALVNKQKIVKGSENLKDFNKSNKIILGVDSEITKSSLKDFKYKVGDKVKLNINNKIDEFEIIAFINYSITNTSRIFSLNVEFDKAGNEIRTMEEIFYLSENNYKKYVDNPSIMVYQYDSSNTLESNKYLEKIVSKNNNLKYDSREKQKESLQSFLNLFLLIGSILSFIMALIGLLNFINVIITNILSRQKELSLMKSIGMTNSEIKKMLRSESLYYFLYTAITSTILSVLFAEFILKKLMENLYFTSYNFTLKGVFITLPIFFIIALTISNTIYNFLNKSINNS